MSEFFAYIATKTTSDPFLPNRSVSLDHLSRDISDAFTALSGGRTTVGQLVLYPIQRSVPNYLLCDGREVYKASFPELYGYLGDSQGTAVDPDKFVLPDYLTAFDPAPAADAESAVAGTVSTPEPVVLPPAYDPNSSTPIYGDVDSGGRNARKLNDPFEDLP